MVSLVAKLQDFGLADTAVEIWRYTCEPTHVGPEKKSVNTTDVLILIAPPSEFVEVISMKLQMHHHMDDDIDHKYFE